VKVYDSLGKSYDAAITYTNQGNNTWTYSISLPDTLTAAPTTAAVAPTLPVNNPAAAIASTVAGTLVPSTAVVGPNTLYSYNFGTGTGGASSSLTINGTAVPVTAGETASALALQISGMGIAGVSAAEATVNGSSVLTITAPTLTPLAGSLVANLPESTFDYNFGSAATVDAATSLTITGQNAAGVASSITVTAGANKSVAAYAAQVQAALTAAAAAGNLTNASATNAGNQLSITGAGITMTGNASQDLSAATIGYTIGGGPTAVIDPTTNLTITGLTSAGVSVTIAAPTIGANENLATYAAALNTALAAANIAGVTVTSTPAGQLSITGANVSTSGSLIQDAVGTNTTGTLIFDTSGNLVSPATNVSNISFAGLSDNSATLNMTWDLYGANGTGTISQTAGALPTTASSQSAETANGYASGTYNGTFTIGSDGTITASYSNSQTQNVGQLALATASNLQGLADVGSTEYEVTGASGLANVGVAGTQGLGTLEGSSLEASNVNISAQFSDLIVAQRAFEANAKSVTTFDTVTQETINMIH